MRDGRLKGNDGNVALTGRFVTKRQPGRAASITGKLNRLPGVSVFADMLDDWEVVGQFILRFGDTRLDFDVKSSTITKVGASRPGREIARPSVQCAELLVAIERITWTTEESIADLAARIESPEAPRPAELLSCHWMIAILWLGIGQDDKAHDAIRAAQRVVSDHPGQIDIRGDLADLGQRLIDGLKTAGLRQIAAGVTDLINSRLAVSG